MKGWTLQTRPESPQRPNKIWLQVDFRVADMVGQLPYRNGCREELVITAWLMSASVILQVFFLHMQMYFFPPFVMKHINSSCLGSSMHTVVSWKQSSCLCLACFSSCFTYLCFKRNISRVLSGAWETTLVWWLLYLPASADCSCRLEHSQQQTLLSQAVGINGDEKEVRWFI